MLDLLELVIPGDGADRLRGVAAGGGGTTCDPCQPGILQHKAGNGAYVNFNVGDTLKSGDSVTFPDGVYHEYHFGGACNQTRWGNIRVQCQDGKLSFASSGFDDGHLCDTGKNTDWKSGNDSISVGYQP